MRLLHRLCRLEGGIGCLYLAVLRRRRGDRDVEGLAAADRLDPVQEAFIEAGAFQCGFCTPGFIMMVKQLLNDNPNPSEDDVNTI